MDLFDSFNCGYNLAKIGHQGATGTRNRALQEMATRRLIALCSGVHMNRLFEILTPCNSIHTLRSEREFLVVIDHLTQEMGFTEEDISRVYLAVRALQYWPYANLDYFLARWLQAHGHLFDRPASLSHHFAPDAVGVSTVMPEVTLEPISGPCGLRHLWPAIVAARHEAECPEPSVADRTTEPQAAEPPAKTAVQADTPSVPVADEMEKRARAEFRQRIQEERALLESGAVTLEELQRDAVRCFERGTTAKKGSSTSRKHQ